MTIGVDGLQQDIMADMGDNLDGAGITKGPVSVFDSVANRHDGDLTKPGLGLIFSQNPEILDCRNAGQNEKIDAVVVPVGDYLSIWHQGPGAAITPASLATVNWRFRRSYPKRQHCRKNPQLI